MSTSVMLPRIESRILTLRGQRVMIDADLAQLYGVETRILNQAVKRNAERFPHDFMFQLTPEEKAEVITICDHLQKLKFSKALPFAFTEYGAVALANVLASSQAVEMGIYVVRAFVQLRQASSLHADLSKRLAKLEHDTERLEMSHDMFSSNTKVQLRRVFDALKELMQPTAPPAPPESEAPALPAPPKRPIGFVHPKETKDDTQSKAVRKAVRAKVVRKK